MFDTKNYDQCECSHVFCEHKFPVHPFQTAREAVAVQSAYDRGYWDGRKDELDKHRLRFKSADEQKKFRSLLEEAIRRLDDLRKQL